MKKNLFFVLGLIFNLILNAQETPPEVSRFLQVNTYNGGQLSHLLSDQNNNSYMTGIANGTNFSFDGYNIAPVGSDDMFVIKTNATGQNQWMKTMNAGKKGVVKPTNTYLNGFGELFVSGSFEGKITFGNQTITSESNKFFIAKYGTDGAEKWISSFSSAVVDISLAQTDVFVAENTKIFKINGDDGTVLASRDMSGYQLKINTLQADILNIGVFVGGISNLTTTLDGISLEQNRAFVLRGNYNSLVFSESSQFTLTDSFGASEVFDIKLLSDRSIAVVGLSSGVTSFKNNVGITSQVNNPSNYSGNGYYFFVAKIAPSFSSLNWFRISTKIEQQRFSPYNNNLDALEIFSYDISNFRVLYKRKIANGINSTYPNGWVDYEQGFVKLFNFEYETGLSNPAISTWSDTFTTGFLTYNGNGVQRYDKTSLFWVTGINGGFQKRKTETELGSLSSNYIKHTGTDGSLINYNYHCGKTNYFGAIINNLGTCSDILSKTAPDGKLVWKSQINATSQTDVYASRTSDLADTNGSGENVVVSQFTHNAEFVDNSNVKSNFGRHNNIFNYVSLITNTNSNGTLKWAKTLEPTSVDAKIKYTSVTYDNNGNVVLAGVTNDTFLVDDLAYNFNKKEVLFLMKLDANTGQVLFAKQFTDMGAYMLNLDTDNENNIYLSYEPMLYNQTTGFYNFGSVQVPISASDLNHFFIKFDSNGNTLLGKNFYANNSATDYDYSWPLSLKFDGTDFIISGEMYSQNKTSYKGIDGQIYTNPYPTYNISDFIAKVDKSGNLIWHKPIFANNRIHQNKADVDDLGNVYYYFGGLGKINIDGNETQLDNANYSAGLLKLSATDGVLKYIKNVGVHKNYLYNSSLSVLQNDILSFSGNADKQNEFIYPIKNHNSSNYYIATFGKLPTPYLTPENDYLLVTNIEVPNNITDNNGDFDLITNVDWTATSNQSWLTLSSEKYTLKASNSASISGSGDHKIMLSAAQNITGNPRSAIITITGNGVTSKEIEVTQSGLLGISQIKERNLLLYPNPTSDYINFSEEVKETSIFDSLGRLVKTAKATSKINISDLPSGIYVVMTTDKYGMSKTTKIIKK